MSEPTSEELAAKSAVEKLEAFFKDLTPGEQDALAPLIANGVLKSVEEASAEVSGFAMAPAFEVGLKPDVLRFMTPDTAPTILDRGEIRGYWPMPY